MIHECQNKMTEFKMQACLSVGLTASEPHWCSQPVRGEESCMLYPHSQLWNLNCEHHPSVSIGLTTFTCEPRWISPGIKSVHQVYCGHSLHLTHLASVAQSLRRVWLFATPWTTAREASLSFTISWSLLQSVSTELMIPSNPHILLPTLLLTSIFPSIRSFPMSWLFTSGGQSLGASASVLPLNIQGRFPLGWTG